MLGNISKLISIYSYVEKGIIPKEVAEGPTGSYRDHPLTQPSVFFVPGTFTQHASSTSG